MIKKSLSLTNFFLNWPIRFLDGNMGNVRKCFGNNLFGIAHFGTNFFRCHPFNTDHFESNSLDIFTFKRISVKKLVFVEQKKCLVKLFSSIRMQEIAQQFYRI